MKTAHHSLLIHNGTIVDGTGAQPVRDGVVLVEAGKLA
jgi:N-acyl-D-aspartate/D-glutamate deacylase